MDVMTVSGPVAPADLGVTLAHEHLLFDGSWLYSPPSDPLERGRAERPLRMDDLGWARKYGYRHLDNSLRLDVEEASREIAAFATRGGVTVIDQTSIGLGRDPAGLRAISEATGLNVVMGCGYYIQQAHPADLAGRSIEDIADEMVRDLTEGVAGTGIRAGIIGEIGVNDPVHRNEERVLKAAARAQAATGAALSIHTGPWSTLAPRLVDIAASEGAEPRRILVCHLDLDAAQDEAYLQRVARTGVFLGCDTFGHYDVHAYGDRARPDRLCSTDWDRVRRGARLVEAGFLRQIVLSHDICHKIGLKSYGGFGYDHLLDSGVWMLEALGLDESQIRTLLVDNPRRLLTGR